MSVAVGTGTVRRAGVAVAFATVAFSLAESAILATGAYADAFESDFALTAGQVGLLASALGIPFALVQVPAGLLGDVWGLRRTFALSMALFGAGFLATAAGESFAMLLAGRALTGLGAGMVVPLASSLARIADPERNMRNQGIVGSGWGIGYVLGLLFVPLLFDEWVAAFAAFGLCALALAPVALALLPDAHADARSALADARSGLRSRRTWTLAAYLWGVGMACVGASSWAIPYLTGERGVGDTGALLMASLVGWGLLPAAIAGGTLARRLSAVTVTTISACGLAVSLVLLAIDAPLPAVAAALFGAGWFTGLPFGVVLGLIATVVEGGGGRAQGPVAGAINGFAFLGSVISPPLVGVVRDGPGSYGAGFAALLIGPAVALAASSRLRGAR